MQQRKGSLTELTGNRLVPKLCKASALLYLSGPINKETRSVCGPLDMTAALRRTLSLSDGVVSFLEWEGPPDGPLLLFLHANGFNAPTYRAMLAPLADRFRIVAPDLRGHGSTRLPCDPRTGNWTLYRDDVFRFLDVLGKRPAVLAGHSMGATVGLMAAAVRPDIADALVLAEPVLRTDAIAAYALFARLLGLEDRLLARVGPAKRRRAQFSSREDAFKAYRGRGAFRTWPEAAVSGYVEGGLVPDAAGFTLACTPAWEAKLYSIFPFGLARLGSRVRIPVTILVGSAHSSADESVVEDFARRNGRTRLVRVPETTHFLPMERPETMRAEIWMAQEQMLPVTAPLSSPSVE